MSHGKDRDKIVGGGVLAPKPAIRDKIGADRANAGIMQASASPWLQPMRFCQLLRPLPESHVTKYSPIVASQTRLFSSCQ